MGKRDRRIFTEEFKQEAVRLPETSGRMIGQVADDLGQPDTLEAAQPGR